MKNIQVTFEFHSSIIECEKELLFIVGDPEKKTCHVTVTLKKVVDIDNERGDLMMKMHKRRAPSEKVIVIERKEKDMSARIVTSCHVHSTIPRGM